MDQTRFDALIRALAAPATRRAGLRAALGGLLGLAALPARRGVARKKKKRTLCPTVCPSGQACVDGACTCTRELCGGVCCAGNAGCERDVCAYIGPRDCGTPKLVDGGDYSYCTLGGKSFSIRTLRNANFEGADLDGAKFTGQFQPWGCRFDRANLSRAELRECDIKPGTSFRGAHLDEARISHGHIDGADFTAAALRNASLMATRVARSPFVGADLDGADLQGATFADCDFTRATLIDSTLGRFDAISSAFTDCAMDGVALRPTRNISQYGLAFASVSMRGAELWTGQVDINTISWLSVDMTGAAGDLPGPRRFGRWCWNVLSDGTQSSQSWGGAACPCAAGPDSCWPTA